jgi:sarcosine oxidase delta subunit
VSADQNRHAEQRSEAREPQRCYLVARNHVTRELVEVYASSEAEARAAAINGRCTLVESQSGLIAFDGAALEQSNGENPGLGPRVLSVVDNLTWCGDERQDEELEVEAYASCFRAAQQLERWSRFLVTRGLVHVERADQLEWHPNAEEPWKPLGELLIEFTEEGYPEPELCFTSPFLIACLLRLAWQDAWWNGEAERIISILETLPDDDELIVRARRWASGLRLDQSGEAHAVFYRRLRMAWTVLEMQENGEW